MIAKKLRVYVAAPYSSNPAANTDRAIAVADELVESGFEPFIPHLFHLWNEHKPHSYGYWMTRCFAWLRNCDVLLRISGESPGADAEEDEARRVGIPVAFSLDELEDVAFSLVGKIPAEAGSR